MTQSWIVRDKIIEELDRYYPDNEIGHEALRVLKKRILAVKL